MKPFIGKWANLVDISPTYIWSIQTQLHNFVDPFKLTSYLHRPAISRLILSEHIIVIAHMVEQVNRKIR